MNIKPVLKWPENRAIIRGNIQNNYRYMTEIKIVLRLPSVIILLIQ